ncbi:MAG: ABC transporter substrate-binding protein, partial [Pseudohongiella sp.]|nr:ABC transporter substrate-binding protein [Pseudohongiella sp.]
MEVLASYELDQMIDQFVASNDVDEMRELSHRMQEFLYEYASFVPGFVQDFYRIGHWRWVKYPAFFNHKSPSLATELHVHWIDEQLKQETLAARRDGRTFEPQIRVYDQYRMQ